MRIGAVILAAGKGTRLKTEAPKVLHEVCGRPMLAYVLDACRAVGVRDCIVVVGYRKERVQETFADDPDITWVTQEPQLGTGHAVMVCRDQLEGRFDHLLVLCGDGPLIRAATLRELIDRHTSEGSSATLATSVLEDPGSYGRIVRDARGGLEAIVEARDATEAQRQIREINPSYYCFEMPDFLEALFQIKPNNVKNEYYITDALEILIKSGRKALAVDSVPPSDVLSINSRQDLALVSRVMRERVLNELMNSGVTVADPTTTWVDSRAQIGQDTILYPNTYIDGPARIGCGCRVGPFAYLTGAVEIPDGGRVPPMSGGAA